MNVSTEGITDLNYTTSDIVTSTGGEILFGDDSVEITGISTDSRTISKGNLFIPLKGDNFNGNDYIQKAIIKGASGVVSYSKEILEREIPKTKVNNKNIVSILVKDTLRAYQDIAIFTKDRISPKVIGITGSNGKSTVKEMTASIMETRFQTLKSESNFNNHVGLPLTLLRLSEGIEVTVLEMGMSGLGEIKRLCEIARPQIGVITNIGMAHLGQLGSLSQIRKAKGELIDSLGNSDIAILNSDDPNVVSYKNDFSGQIITFGIETDADIKGENIKKNGWGYIFTLKANNNSIEIQLNHPGYHNIYNALAAASVGIAMELNFEEIKNGLESYKSLPMRMECIQSGGITIINDTYNANPGSMTMAIKTLDNFETSGKRILVLGDMLELGIKSKEAHMDSGRQIALSGIDYLFTFGEMSSFTADESINNGLSKDRVYKCENFEGMAKEISEKLNDGDCMLVKGSRGMHMETVIDLVITNRKKVI